MSTCCHNLESFNHEPSGFEIEPRGFEDRTLLGSISNPEGFEDRTLLGSCLRTLCVPRTQKGSYLRTLLGSRSNPLGSMNPEGSKPRRVRSSNPSGFVEPRGFEEPSGFDLEPRRVRRYEPFWVRGTQRVRRTNPLGSWNPEGFEDMNPSGFEDTNPEGFDLRTLLGSRSNPEGFDLRTLWVRSRTQRVRRSSKMNFEDEVHLRRTKMNFKKFFFFFFSWWRSNLDLHH
ncbi:hypothetical protein ACOSQ2_026849 [Xanthoceras sorbifolium]